MSYIENLIERLQKGPVSYEAGGGPVYAGPDALHRGAASALSHQSKEIAHLRAGLEKIAALCEEEGDFDAGDIDVDGIRDIAVAHLMRSAQ